MDDHSPLSGHLADCCFAELLYGIYAAKLSGVLSIERRGVKKALYFNEGEFRYARSTEEQDSLEAILLRTERLSREAYHELMRATRPGSRFEVALHESGYLSEDALAFWLRYRSKEICYSIFSWDDGDYELNQCTIEPYDRVSLTTSVPSIVLEGIHRLPDEVVRRQLGSLSDRLFIAPDGQINAHQINLTQAQRSLLTHIDGKASIEELCFLSPLGFHEVCRILYALLVLRVLGRSQRTDTSTGVRHELVREHTPPRILLVESETVVRLSLVQYLSSRGYEVLEATDGAEALGMANNSLPHLIITEVVMPRLDGFMLIKMIRASSRAKDVPILVLSAKDKDEDVEQGLSSGANYYMTKPFSLGELGGLVGRMLGRL